MPSSSAMSVRNTAQSSMTRCQSLFRRDSRETSVTMTMPTSPRPIAATRRWKPRRRWLPAPDKPGPPRAAASRQPEVVVDHPDRRLRPAHLPGAARQVILAAGALLVVLDLLRRGPAGVEDGAQRQGGA